jgi:hypothetical protein
VHQLGQETLAGARLAQDEDRGQAARGLALVPEQPADLLSHTGDAGTFAQELRQGRHPAPILPADRGAVEAVSNSTCPRASAITGGAL